MHFAYADPPYPGQSKRWYGSHRDYAGEVDHGELIGRLCRDYADGWALSTSMPALQQVLGLCPPGVRIAVWHRTNSGPGFMSWHWHFCWEPVIVCGGRPNKQVRNVLAAPIPMGWIRDKIKGDSETNGQKPERFALWVTELLGYQDGDTIDDLFPGSGVCGRVFAARDAQPTLGLP